MPTHLKAVSYPVAQARTIKSSRVWAEVRQMIQDIGESKDGDMRRSQQQRVIHGGVAAGDPGHDPVGQQPQAPGGLRERWARSGGVRPVIDRRALEGSEHPPEAAVDLRTVIR